jgi:cytochrome c553
MRLAMIDKRAVNAITRPALVALAALALSGPAFAAKGDPEAGKAKAVPCKACHGESGISVSPEFPKIAGQHADYLAIALKHYKLGKRKNPIMAGQVANLSDKDMLDLAAYFSTQPGLTLKY